MERATLEDYARAVNPDGSIVDPHTAVAARMFGVVPEKVTREMRKYAKRVNYAEMYGARGKR